MALVAMRKAAPRRTLRRLERVCGTSASTRGAASAIALGQETRARRRTREDAAPPERKARRENSERNFLCATALAWDRSTPPLPGRRADGARSRRRQEGRRAGTRQGRRRLFPPAARIPAAAAPP